MSFGQEVFAEVIRRAAHQRDADDEAVRLDYLEALDVLPRAQGDQLRGAIEGLSEPIAEHLQARQVLETIIFAWRSVDAEDDAAQNLSEWVQPGPGMTPMG